MQAILRHLVGIGYRLPDPRMKTDARQRRCTPLCRTANANLRGSLPMRVALASISMGVALTQLGCATSAGNPPYPTAWASIKSAPTQEGCPDLQGTYINQGTGTFPPEAGATPSLAEIFTTMARSQTMTGPAAWKRSWPTIPLDAAFVSIEQAPEAISITFIEASGRRTPLIFRRYRFKLSEDRVDDLFSCRALYGEPTLRFFNEPLSHASASIVAVGGGGASVALLKAIDGSLVVNWRADAVTLTLFVLGSGYRVDNLWHRYSPVPAADPLER